MENLFTFFQKILLAFGWGHLVSKKLSKKHICIKNWYVVEADLHRQILVQNSPRNTVLFYFWQQHWLHTLATLGDATCIRLTPFVSHHPRWLRQVVTVTVSSRIASSFPFEYCIQIWQCKYNLANALTKSPNTLIELQFIHRKFVS